VLPTWVFFMAFRYGGAWQLRVFACVLAGFHTLRRSGKLTIRHCLPGATLHSPSRLAWGGAGLGGRMVAEGHFRPAVRREQAQSCASGCELICSFEPPLPPPLALWGRNLSSLKSSSSLPKGRARRGSLGRAGGRALGCAGAGEAGAHLSAGSTGPSN